jgi:hypothetical protein
MLAGGIFIWLFESLAHVFFIDPQGSLLSSLSDTSVHELYTRLASVFGFSLLIVILFKNKSIREKKAEVENIFNNVIPICITNLNYEIVKANDSYWTIWERTGDGPLKCYDHRPGKSCHTKGCALTQIIGGAKEYVCDSQKKHNGKNNYFVVTARPYLDHNKKMIGIVESFQDITERKKIEEEKNKLVAELQGALGKVKLLSGFIPICASCKKIRNDQGFWTQIESYIRTHSEAEFSHGICPDCAKKLYPDLVQPEAE